MSLRDKFVGSVNQLGKAMGRNDVTIVEMIRNCHCPQNISCLWKKFLNLMSETLVRSSLCNNSKNRHVIRQPLMKQNLRIFNPSAILLYAKPCDMYVLVWVWSTFSILDHRKKLIKSCLKVLYFKPSCVEDMNRYVLFKYLPSVWRNRSSLSGFAELTLEN